MSDELKIGLIGLDTSHAIAFTRILNNADDPSHVPGGRVIAGFPGGSEDFPASIERVGGFTDQLRDEYDVEIMDTPEAVAEAADVVFITAVDGRVHRELFERVASFQRPTFIDKPLATTVADAEEIVRLAREAQVPMMSCSAVRYSDNLRDSLARDPNVLGCDVFGPMDFQPTQPGVFWYGVHAIDALCAAMGAGCREVRDVADERCDLMTLRWDDGRIATYRGRRSGHKRFGITLHREHGFETLDLQDTPRSYYAALLEVVLATLPAGQPDLSGEDMLQTIRILQAANASRPGGEPVEV